MFDELQNGHVHNQGVSRQENAVESQENTLLLSSEESTQPQEDSKCVKLTKTISLSFALSTVGLIMGLNGTTFLDLLAITGSSVQSGSLLFAVAGLGSLVGSAIAGRLCDRTAGEILLSFSLSSAAILCTFLPWLTSAALMQAVGFLLWVAIGITETVVPYLVILVWKHEDAPYTQSIYLSFSLGGLVAPFISEPFLTNTNGKNENTRLTQLADVTNISSINSTFSRSDERLIHIPYLIVGAIHLTAAIPWFIFYIMRKGVPHYKDEIKTCTEKTSTPETDRFKRILFLTLTPLFFIFFDAVEDGFQNYVMIIVVSKGNWTMSDGAKVSSLYWGCFTGGKLFAIFAAQIIPPFWLLIPSLFALNLSFAFWIYLFHVGPLVTWISVALIGVFMSPIYAISVTVTNRFMTSGKIAALILVSSNLGDTLVPFLIGYYLEFPDPMASVDVLLISGILSFVIMVTIRFVVFAGHDPNLNTTQG